MTRPVFPCTCDPDGVARFGCYEHGPAPREHPVLCVSCLSPTWAVSAVCPGCEKREARFAALRRRPQRGDDLEATG